MSFTEIAANVRYFIEKHNIREVCLSGGEPTVHPDFLASLSYVRGAGSGTVPAHNAIRFGGRELVDECAGLINRVLVGLSCHNEQLCAALTGTKNTFQTRIAGIENLLASSLPVRTNTVVLNRITGSCRRSAGQSARSAFPGLCLLCLFSSGHGQPGGGVCAREFRRTEEYLARAIDILQGRGIKVFLQGCRPASWMNSEELREIDPDRAFVDSRHQLDRHGFLFSGMLGYAQEIVAALCL